MGEIVKAVAELLNNPAFWSFLGVFFVAYFGYKQVVKKPTSNERVDKAEADTDKANKKAAKSASSFEELREVVGVLQDELIKKDKRHAEDTNYLIKQVREARAEIEDLRQKYAGAVKQITITNNRNEDLTREVNVLKKRLKKQGIA